MKPDQLELLNKIATLSKKVQELHETYWKHYSFNHWQFWINIFLFIAPLILLIFYLDRKKTFQILFFGFTIHVLMNYIDSIAGVKGFIRHPYPITPFMEVNLSMNTSLIPVLYMLVYQFGINRHKNLFLWGLFPCAFTGLFMGTITEDLHLLQLLKSMNIGILFIINYLEFLIAYGLTSYFVHFQK